MSDALRPVIGWGVDVATYLRTGTSGPKVSSFMHSILVVTWVSRVGSTKDPSSLRPPRTRLAPWDTASEMCSATCRMTPHRLSDLEKLLKEVRRP